MTERPVLRAGLLAAALLLGGCTAVDQGTIPSPASTETASIDVVVFGDSLSVDPPVNCAGCTSWPAQVVSGLADRTGQEIRLSDQAVPDTGIAQTIRNVAVHADELAHAQIVLVWIGNNDGPPWPDASPCGHVDQSTPDSTIAGVGAYDDACVASTVAEYADLYVELFDTIADAAPDARLFALTTPSNWEGNAYLDGVTAPASQLDGVLEIVARSFDDWNEAQCAAAEDATFTCIDVYHRMNGADGRDAIGALTGSDGTHLSQAGHDAVAELVLAALAP